MTVVAGPLFAAAGLLAAAGAVKLVQPASTIDALRAAALPGTGKAGRAPDRLWVGRLLGLFEVAVAVIALSIGGRLAGVLVSAAYLGFAFFTVRLLSTAGAGASCGCFGGDESPATPLHVIVNGSIAVVAALAVAWPTPGIADVLRHQPLGGVPFVVLCGVLGWLLFALLTVVPELQAAMAEAPARPRRSSSGR